MYRVQIVAGEAKTRRAPRLRPAHNQDSGRGRDDELPPSTLRPASHCNECQAASLSGAQQQQHCDSVSRSVRSLSCRGNLAPARNDAPFRAFCTVVRQSPVMQTKNCKTVSVAMFTLEPEGSYPQLHLDGRGPAKPDQED